MTPAAAAGRWRARVGPPDRWPPAPALERACDIVFVGAALVAWVVLLDLGKGVTFFQDEWRFVDVDGPFGTPYDLVKPHNEHWSTLSFLLYRSIFAVVGLSTYLPYLAVLLGLHLLAAAGVYVLLRRRNGAPVALAASLLVLWLGTGYQNLFWAFQIGFVGSVAAGAWALVMLERPERWAPIAGAGLLLGGVMSSGIGLVFAAAAGAELLVDPARRRRLAALVPVGLAYAAWYLALGRTGVTDGRSPFSLAALADVPRFVWIGTAGSVEAAIGRPFGFEVVPLALAAGLLLLPVLWLVRLRVPARALGAVGGLVVLFGVIGLVRGHLGDEQPLRSRYQYEGVILVVLAASGVLGGRLRPSRSDLARPSSVGLAVALAVALVSGLGHNAEWLLAGRRDWQNRANETRAYIALLDVVPRSALAPPPSVPWNIPLPHQMEGLIASHGSPARDALRPGVVPSPTPNDEDRALFRLVGGAFRIVPTSDVPPGTPPMPATPVAPVTPALVRIAGGSASPGSDGCLTFEPGWPVASVTFQVPDGAVVTLAPAGTAAAEAWLGQRAHPQPVTALGVPLSAAGPTAIAVPALGDDRRWYVRLELPREAGTTRICAAAGEGAAP